MEGCPNPVEALGQWQRFLDSALISLPIGVFARPRERAKEIAKTRGRKADASEGRVDVPELLTLFLNFRPDYSKCSFETIKDDVDAITEELEAKRAMNETEEDALRSFCLDVLILAVFCKSSMR